MAPRSDPSAAERVAEQLRRELLNGELTPGQRIREEELCARLGCGRYTVRAAISSLVDSRLLVHERHRGAMVPELTRERIDEVFGYRAALELGSLRLALERRDDFRAVDDAVEALAALPPDVEWLQLTEAHARIHAEIVHASGNSRLISAYDNCQDELNLLFVALRPDFTVERFAALHRELVAQLRIGGETALLALRHDMEGDGYRALLAALGTGDGRR